MFVWFLTTCSQQQTDTMEYDPDNGITADMLPNHIKSLYNLKAAADTSYTSHVKNMYFKYLEKGENDSALFCLIAWHEVLDQNYIDDKEAMLLAKEHLKNGLNTNQNQGELLKLAYYIGSMYFTQENADSCKHWLLLGKNHENSLAKTKIRCNTMLANLYENFNLMDSAITLKQENLQYYSDKNDSLNFTLTSINIAKSYRYVYAFEMAKNYISQALKTAESRNDTFSIIIANKELINIKLDQNSNDSSIIQPTYTLNRYSNPYSRKNLNLSYIQAEANFTLHFVLENIDSMQYWLDIFKDICYQRGGMSINRYQSLENILNISKNKPLTNMEYWKNMAREYYSNESYKDAYESYFFLLNNALHFHDYRNAYAYKDTLNKINEILFETINKGKLLELEVKYKTKIKDQELQLEKLTIKKLEQKFLYIIISVVLLILLVIIYLLMQQKNIQKMKKEQEQLFTKTLMEQSEEERRRIAQDLHDSVGHELVSLKNLIINNINFNETSIDKVINEVREISRNLFPVLFEEVGLCMSTEQLINKLSFNGRLHIFTEFEYEKNRLSSKKELVVYRIIQEALTNVLKYAEAKSAKVEIKTIDNKLEVRILDNGKGFNVEETWKSNKGFGLHSMYKRSEFVNAKLSIKSSGQGTHIELIVPLDVKDDIKG